MSACSALRELRADARNTDGNEMWAKVLGRAAHEVKSHPLRIYNTTKLRAVKNVGDAMVKVSFIMA